MSYTVKEIEQMREIIHNFIRHDEFGKSCSGVERDVKVESQLNTYIAAGITLSDLKRREGEKIKESERENKERLARWVESELCWLIFDGVVWRNKDGSKYLAISNINEYTEKFLNRCYADELPRKGDFYNHKTNKYQLGQKWDEVGRVVEMWEDWRENRTSDTVSWTGRK